MYKEHPTFEAPEDKNIKVWRYMDVTKFISLLHTRALFFSRSDKLGDPFEGSYPLGNADRRLSAYYGYDRFPGIYHKLREWTTVSCWHINETESDAMWKLYLSSNEGIAIQSTFKRLANSFKKVEQDVFIGKVKYIDYETQTIPEVKHLGDAFYPFLYKRNSFEHERELRAIVQEIPLKRVKNQWDKYEYHPDMSEKGVTYGKAIPIELGHLVERIYVSPASPTWVKEVIESLIKKYRLKKPIIQSELIKDPFFDWSEMT
jgi:hypothetical protein